MDTTRGSPAPNHSDQTPDEPAFLTYDELHRFTNLPLGTLYAMVANNAIPHVRLGKRLVRFPRAEIQRWLTERTVMPKAVTR